MEIREYEMSNDFFVSITENNSVDLGISFNTSQNKICFEHWTKEETHCHYITFDEFEKIIEYYKKSKPVKNTDNFDILL
jgi:hypothetical protein